VVVLGVSWSESESGREDEMHGMSEPELYDFRRGAETLEGIGAYYTTAVNVTGSEGDAERVPTGVMTADVFSVLGVSAAVGRTFTSDEDSPSAPRVALLGHDLWQRRYAGDPDIVGRDVMVNGIPRTVVGIMDAGFRLPVAFATSRSQLWLPIRFDEDNLGGRGGHYLDGVARVKPGVTVEQVNSELLSIGNALTEQGLYQQSANFRGVVTPVDEFVVGNVRPALLVLFGAVALVLLIACANVANLMLARGEARKLELAVRAALGAGRGVLGRQVLTEAVVLGLVGGLAGLALARVGLGALIAFDPASVPRLSEVRLDVAVLAYATIVSLATSLLFGLAPAIRGARGADLQSELKDGAWP
jgi:putative ABC transport system permease protein